jgi:hypothetical protein
LLCRGVQTICNHFIMSKFSISLLVAKLASKFSRHFALHFTFGKRDPAGGPNLTGRRGRVANLRLLPLRVPESRGPWPVLDCIGHRQVTELSVATVGVHDTWQAAAAQLLTCGGCLRCDRILWPLAVQGYIGHRQVTELHVSAVRDV